MCYRLTHLTCALILYQHRTRIHFALNILFEPFVEISLFSIASLCYSMSILNAHHSETTQHQNTQFKSNKLNRIVNVVFWHVHNNNNSKNDHNSSAWLWNSISTKSDAYFVTVYKINKIRQYSILLFLLDFCVICLILWIGNYHNDMVFQLTVSKSQSKDLVRLNKIHSLWPCHSILFASRFSSLTVNNHKFRWNCSKSNEMETMSERLNPVLFNDDDDDDDCIRHLVTVFFYRRFFINNFKYRIKADI